MDFIKQEKLQRAVLVGLNCSSDKYDIKSSDETLKELESLLETAGGESLGIVLQNRDLPDAKFFIGEGKVSEIAEFAKANDADLIIFDNELSPSQIKNIEKETGIRVIDRTMLILDIFSLHATTREGKLQVEMALMKYTIPRLTGMGTELSRLGGGGGGAIGARRGAGETKLEIDKRHLKEQIRQLQKELDEIRENRQKQRKERDVSGVPKVAVIGYTNAGKSTLLNTLTGAGVLAENKLFATLDPTTRRMKMENGFEVLITDTVGFIRKLPHHLVEAFAATLEEVKYADLLVNVVDATSPEMFEHINVTHKLINDLGAGGIPVITAINKTDLLEEGQKPVIKDSVPISAKKGTNINLLCEMIYNRLSDMFRRAVVIIPYDKGGLLDEIYRDSKATVEESEYVPEGVRLTITMDVDLYGRLKDYVTGDENGVQNS
ncbi:MAG: GTPase HflX [Bacillota bacterium]|nr:GTPase HflX [Bacillota bacterium]